MKVTYSPRAVAQLNKIFAYIAKDNPAAAQAVIRRIESVAALLADFPLMGHATDDADFRVAYVERYPYLVFYAVLPESDEVRIVRIQHAARQRSPD